MPRKRILSNTIDEVLLQSRRRCAICFGYNSDTRLKPGQVAHIDRDNTNAALENLVFLCLVHHDQYDSKTSQSKGITLGEVKHFRDELYKYIQKEHNIAWADYPMRDSSKDSERTFLSTELYDRKIQAYRTVRKFLGVVFAEGTVTTQQLLSFANDTDEVIFLFDRELAEYLKRLYKKAARLSATDKRLANQYLPIGEERSKLAEENAEILMWLTDQFDVVRDHFYKHIALK